MIVKMKFLSITGPKNDIERMAGQYLSKYEIPTGARPDRA